MNGHDLLNYVPTKQYDFRHNIIGQFLLQTLGITAMTGELQELHMSSVLLLSCNCFVSMAFFLNNINLIKFQQKIKLSLFGTEPTTLTITNLEV